VIARGLAVAAFAAGSVQAAPLEVRVSGDGGVPLAGAVVFLEPQGSAAGREPVRPLAGIEIAQADKQFQPAVSVVTVGTAVAFPNRDTVRHHVYSFSPAKRFEIKLYVGTPAAPVVFDQPGIALIGCNIHDRMTAWVLIVDTPWHGRSDAQGRFTLAQVPPGVYKLRTWHARMPVGAVPLEQPLRIDAGSATALAQVALTGLAEP
jgi:plastocyanin